MSMSKEVLRKFAEHGVRQRLAEIQQELNDLARDFPHIVCDQDGAVPAVLPVTMKPTRPQGKKSQVPRATRLAAIRAYLVDHPGATTNEVAAAQGLSNGQALQLLKVGSKVHPSRYPAEMRRWSAKPGKKP